MHISEQDLLPKQAESLAEYIRRLRAQWGLSQRELAERAGIHLQSLGKIERGQTTRLNRKPKEGLARALSIPPDYLDATARGNSVPAIASLKFCPNCWVPGTPPDPMWTNLRSRYCFACGGMLHDRCTNCNELIASLKFRFCPYCGQSYKNSTSNRSLE